MKTRQLRKSIDEATFKSFGDLSKVKGTAT